MLIGPLDPYSTIFARRDGVDFAPWLGARRARACEFLREIMLSHHYRRATLPGSKSGPPLRGRSQKSRCANVVEYGSRTGWSLLHGFG